MKNIRFLGSFFALKFRFGLTVSGVLTAAAETNSNDFDRIIWMTSSLRQEENYYFFSPLFWMFFFLCVYSLHQKLRSYESIESNLRKNQNEALEGCLKWISEPCAFRSHSREKGFYSFRAKFFYMHPTASLLIPFYSVDMRFTI